MFKRYLLLMAGLLFQGIGVAFTKHGELGVSPISSVANVMSCKFTEISLGTWLIIWNCVLIICQIVILKRDFQIFQFLQIPLSVLFGCFTDFGMWLVAFIPVSNYIVKLVMLFIGIIILAFGITLSVIANVILNSGEAVVKAVSDKSGKNFGDLKVAFDVSCVVIAVVLSLILFKGQIFGTREGTIISALCTGIVVKFFTKSFQERIDGLLR